MVFGDRHARLIVFSYCFITPYNKRLADLLFFYDGDGVGAGSGGPPASQSASQPSLPEHNEIDDVFAAGQFFVVFHFVGGLGPGSGGPTTNKRKNDMHVFVISFFCGPEGREVYSCLEGGEGSSSPLEGEGVAG